MTWSPHLPYRPESDKIWPFAIPYTHGRGLDIGCGAQPCLPHMVGVDMQDGAAVQVDGRDLHMFADASLDFIFSSHFLEHIDKDEVPAALDHWGSKLKVGGYIVLYLPDAWEYPKIGAPGSNPEHKWDVFPGDIEKAFKAGKGGRWRQVECEKRNAYDEYSIFEVWQKAAATIAFSDDYEAAPDAKIELPDNAIDHDHWRDRMPKDRKRCLIVRLGAIGDCLVAASPCAALQQDGYHVTMITSAAGGEILENNPYIDELIVADKGMFPPGGILAFTETMKERYDHVINLDRSLEGLLLAREENYSFEYPAVARRMLMGHMSYLSAAHAIAEVPLSREDVAPAPGFHKTQAEDTWARRGRESVDAPLIMWVVSGSSFFKVYPAVNVVANMLAEKGINVVFVGNGGVDRILEGGIILTMAEDGADTTKVYPRCGQWSVRQTMTFAQHVDLVVGPETGIMHAVSLSGVPKVVILSHSSREQLIPHWRNTMAVYPEREVCPCYPCHQIHTVRETCNFDHEAGAALCQSMIPPQEIFDAIMQGMRHQSEDRSLPV